MAGPPQTMEAVLMLICASAAGLTRASAIKCRNWAALTSCASMVTWEGIELLGIGLPVSVCNRSVMVAQTLANDLTVTAGPGWPESSGMFIGPQTRTTRT